MTRRALLAWSTACLLAGIMFSPPAHADPTSDYLRGNGYLICQIITNRPGQDTLNRMVTAIETDGFTNQQASDILWASVIALCPEHTELLQQTVARNERQMPV